MAAEGSTFADVAQKEAQVSASLAQEDEAIAAMEADLQAAESRVEVAEARYQRARRAIERELKEAGEEAAPAAGAATAEVDVPDHLEADREPTHMGSHTAKNAGARTDKEVSSEKWLAARAAEGRVRDRATKARERLRRNARDRKFQWAEGPGEEAPAEAAPPAAAAPEAPAAPKPALPADAPAVKAGAEGLAERLKCIAQRSNAAEKRAAVGRVTSGGKDNYYTFEPADVVDDLKQRSLLEAAVADELLALLKEAPAAKPAEVPAEGWAAGAQKASAIDRLDDKPFKDEESAYLKFVEERGWRDAEAELQKAEAQLGKLVSEVAARYGDLGDADAGPELVAAAGEVQVDLDEAERLEAHYDPDGHRESRGSKNTSALPPKVASHQKWVKAHDKEGREREHEAKARDARRTEARDMKHGAAEPGE